MLLLWCVQGATRQYAPSLSVRVTKMSKRIEPYLRGVRKHTFPDKMKSLAAKALARKIGYLRIDGLPSKSLFDKLPVKDFASNRIIQCRNEICLIKGGSVQIRHRHRKYLVTELTTGSLFGDIALLGQTMLMTQAVAGQEGARLAVMDIITAQHWVRSNPVAILEKIGTRLVTIEAEHYRSEFQLADSKVAGLLLRLADEHSTVLGISHQQIGEMLGMYRETVTTILDLLKAEKLIEVGRKRIKILEKRALQELAEL